MLMVNNVFNTIQERKKGREKDEYCGSFKTDL